MQPSLALRDSIRRKGVIFLAGGAGRVSAVDTRDLADVAVAALTGPGHEGKVYSITGPKALSFAEMAAQLGAALGRPLAYIDVPPEAMLAGMDWTGTPEWRADGLIEEFGMYSRGEAAGVEPGVQEALGRPPRIFVEFARDYTPHPALASTPDDARGSRRSSIADSRLGIRDHDFTRHPIPLRRGRRLAARRPLPSRHLFRRGSAVEGIGIGFSRSSNNVNLHMWNGNGIETPARHETRGPVASAWDDR